MNLSNELHRHEPVQNSECPCRILVVDDDVALLRVIETSLNISGRYEIQAVNAAAEAMKLVESGDFDLVVSDYSLGDASINGLDILKSATTRDPGILGIIITAFASLEISLEAIHLGAYDFLTKPFQIDELNLTVRNAAERVRLSRENERLREEVAELAQSLREVAADHQALMEQLESLRNRPAPMAGPPAPGSALAADLQPRVNAYLKMARTVGEKLDRENSRLETMFRDGLISEPTYRKGIGSRQRPTGS